MRTYAYTVIAKGFEATDRPVKFTGTVKVKALKSEERTIQAANRKAVKEALGGNYELCLMDVFCEQV